MIVRLMNLVAPKVNILGGLLGFPLQLLLTRHCSSCMTSPCKAQIGT
jgi:hypothetical protein